MSSYPPPTPPSADEQRYGRRIAREQARAQQQTVRGQRRAYERELRSGSRSSITGPLLVIALGVLFLLVQLGKLSMGALLGWYSRWWPALLIGVGALLIAEWGLDRIGSGAPRRRSIGTGASFVLVLLVLAGLALSRGQIGRALLADHLDVDSGNLDEFLGDKHESNETYTESVQPGSVLTVQNPRGDILITGGSSDGQVHIQLHREVYSRSEHDASEKAEQLAPHISNAGESLSVSLPSLNGGRTDLTLTVPADMAETLTSDHGDVRVSGIKGALSVVANHGDVELNALNGPATVHTNNGDSSLSAHQLRGALTLAGKGNDVTLSDIDGDVTLSGNFFGTTHLERVRGTLRFHSSRTDLQVRGVPGDLEISPNAELTASDVTGPMQLNTRNRNVTVRGITGDLALTNRNGTVEIQAQAPLGNLSIENRNGPVDVTLPAASAFALRADTTDGDIETYFGVPVQQDESRSSASGTVGSGGPTIHVSTSQGDVTIKRGPGNATVPRPPTAAKAPHHSDALKAVDSPESDEE